MQTFVIGDGLTKDFLSDEAAFAGSRQNVGRAEMDRLLGRGKNYGHGPLGSFLQAVAGKAREDADTHLILLQGEAPVPEVLQEPLAAALTIPSPADTIPWRELGEAMTGRRDEPEARILVVGCHTERRILALASYLHNVLGYTQVAVSPHLMGSATPEAHFAALRHHFPSIGIHIILDLQEAAGYAGLDPSSMSALPSRPPQLGPDETCEALEGPQRRILELLCLNWSRAELRPLAGGFSGSLLLLAHGWKGQARTEPMVLKVDGYAQMRRELDGYYQVKDFFGKHVPTFGYPVAVADTIGVGMELAAMEGSPRTLQATFEDADSDQSLNQFLEQLDKSLSLLSEKLYRNTCEASWVVPYRAFGMHAEQQIKYLLQNAACILSYLEEELPAEGRVDAEQLGKLLRLVAANPDGIDSEMCLVHGDLNYANIICDEGNNIWFIDWTHCGLAPIEQDFAKLENDVKFVMSKTFDAGDLPRLRMLEDYLLQQRIPGDANTLPERLKFVKWDLRFRKILETVRRVRQAGFALKQEEDWLIYRVALLRYATHSLSFDQRRGRGECEPPQLMHALYAVEALIYNLVADDFHLKIRAERPAGYPQRQRISIDESPWMLDCETYDPPYYVDADVLGHERGKVDGGWADPEDFSAVGNPERFAGVRFRDEEGRPRNPRGRTGLEGRGLLGLWGPNLSVVPLMMRTNPDSGHLEILLGSRDEAGGLEVLKGFVLPDESGEDAARRVLTREARWDIGDLPLRQVYEGYTYDARQTDHAWVESRAVLGLPETPPSLLEARGEFEAIKWWPLDSRTLNRIPSSQARFVRESLPQLVEAGRLDQAAADALLAATG